MGFRVTPGMTFEIPTVTLNSIQGLIRVSRKHLKNKINQDEIPGHARNDDCFFGLASP